MKIVFNINPYPKRTPIFSARGKFVRVVPNKKTVSFQNKIKAIALSKYKGPLIEGPFKARITFFIEKPKSVKRHYPSVKPDLDNLSKSFMDALQEIIFKNDSLAIDLRLSKRYAEKGKIILEIEEIKEWK